MYDPERGWSLSFAGCGFMGFYHIGATRCLSEHAPHLLRDARMLLGCSAGALHCVTFLSGMPLDKILQVFMDMAREARRRNIGILHPSFNLGRYIRNQLQLYLPANVHQIVSGRVSISLTRVSDGENVLVSDFQSKEEVVDALLCSCFIPFYSGLIPPAFRGERYVDGGVSDNVPSIDARTTITVSPFYGEHDICPKVKSTNFLHVNITNLSLRLCLGNVYLITQAIFPPDTKVLGEICVRGYLDAFRFLEENGICSRPQRCLSLLPTEPAPEAHAPHGEGTSREPSPGPEGDELLEHLRASILPWDDGVLQTMSPRLTTVLNETIKDRGGYLSKICNLLPVRVVSYVMLPCTLPVESAIAAVRGLVLWLPDLPDDVQWLQWLVSQMFARLTSCLLPASRLAASMRLFDQIPKADEWPARRPAGQNMTCWAPVSVHLDAFTSRAEAGAAGPSVLGSGLSCSGSRDLLGVALCLPAVQREVSGSGLGTVCAATSAHSLGREASPPC